MVCCGNITNKIFFYACTKLPVLPLQFPPTRHAQPKQTMITNDTSIEHVNGLANSKEVIQDVDKTAFENEIRDAIEHLKWGTSHGLENIINEYFIEFSGSLIPLSYTLFNRIWITVHSCLFLTPMYVAFWAMAVRFGVITKVPILKRYIKIF